MTVELLADERWAGSLRGMLEGVRHEAVMAIARPVRPESEYRSEDMVFRRLHEAGKQVRLLLSSAYVGSRGRQSVLRQFSLGSRIRVTDTDFCNVLIIDRERAALWSAVPGAEPRGYLVAEPALLGVVHQFAVRTWHSARALRDHLELWDGGLDAVALAVVEQLNAGAKDETAARALGVSLRTYRRYVAALMARFDVSTRFQLGVRVRELGLLS
ncbi:response regulator transcription factor [Nocardia aurantiaca]|uniref:HTH luxR-type domain-containing protein n=1 Tax=Nocardia aurantiaca TaxID=2675850 RepID=A0A6I3KMM7_9NOCA|nr:response regulator transcription factor [Nocardia aurantiaca]MTE11222.1 hypothetical protein [Nocardia aurantiaca]